ncbi:unnamed protein product, partial [Mesorhabditis belari]|uniref:Delta-like protein n=1 Tax=Mesorhabditis belari TaxID=2138241 RepID=A0AAF3EML7_9BILA
MNHFKLIWIILLSLFKPIYGKGWLDFSLNRLSWKVQKENGSSLIGTLCVGLRRVGMTDRSKDCSLAHHQFEIESQIFSETKAHKAKIPFTVRWPAQKTIYVTFTANTPNDLEGIVLFEQRRLFQFNPKSFEFKLKEQVAQNSIDFSLRVRCADHFFGDGCDLFCETSKSFDSTGKFNYSCGPEGERLCSAGWSGFLCDTPMCNENCLHGECIGPNKCSCFDGWMGEKCERCVRKNGCKMGFCNLPGECRCENGWIGDLCEREQSICETKNPCIHGSCHSTKNAHLCNCTQGFTGQNCDQKIEISTISIVPSIPSIPIVPMCTPKLCKNGRCIQHFDGQKYGLKCECLSGFHGEKCEQSNDDFHKANQSSIFDSQLSNFWTSSHLTFIFLTSSFTLVNLCGCVCCWRFMKKISKGKANIEMDCFAVTTHDKVVLRPSVQFFVDEPFLQPNPLSSTQFHRFSLDYPPLIVTSAPIPPPRPHAPRYTNQQQLIDKNGWISKEINDRSPPCYNEHFALENAMNECQEKKKTMVFLGDPPGVTEDEV